MESTFLKWKERHILKWFVTAKCLFCQLLTMTNFTEAWRKWVKNMVI